jgi:acyl carrier protein
MPAKGREQLVILQELQRNGGHYHDLALISAMAARAVAVQHGVLPAAIVLLPVNALPRTSSGKLQRLEARQLYRDGLLTPLHVWRPGSTHTDRGVTPLRPGTAELLHRDWQEELCQEVQLWVAEKLDVEPHHVTLDVTFVDLGIDSVEAVELMKHLQERVGRPIPPIPAIKMLRYPTVKALIEDLAAERQQHQLLRLQCEETFALGAE